MTKQHFIELANVIRCANNNGNAVFSTEAVKELASFCKRANPAFKSDRWFDYIDGKCGPNGGKIQS